MSKVKVRITAQNFENYNFFNGGTPNWKPKGGRTFILESDSDLFFYDEDVCIDAIGKMLEEQSTSIERFEYVSHEVIFHDEIELSSDRFEALFNKMAQDKYTLTHNA